MLINVTSDSVSRSADKEQRLLRSLAEDLQRVERGFRPDLTDLENAPFLDEYVVTTRVMPVLAGNVRGHPLLRDQFVNTSGLWMLSPTLGWARTLSRFYRLGNPAGDYPSWAVHSGR